MQAMDNAILGLQKAADLIEHRGWVREHYAVDENGEYCAPTDPNAAKFCVTGAVEAAFHLPELMSGVSKDYRAQEIAEYALDGQILKDYNCINPVSWNDDHAKSRRQVALLLRRTARNLTKAERT